MLLGRPFHLKTTQVLKRLRNQQKYTFLSQDVHQMDITSYLSLCVCVWGHLNSFILANFNYTTQCFQLQSIVVTMLYDPSSDLSYLTTGNLYPFTNLFLFSLPPYPGNHFSTLAVTSFYVEVLEIHLCRVFKFHLKYLFLTFDVYLAKNRENKQRYPNMTSACQCLGFLPPISVWSLLSLLWDELGRGGSPSNLRSSLITAATL